MSKLKVGIALIAITALVIWGISKYMRLGPPEWSISEKARSTPLGCSEDIRLFADIGIVGGAQATRFARMDSYVDDVLERYLNEDKVIRRPFQCFRVVNYAEPLQSLSSVYDKVKFLNSERRISTVIWVVSMDQFWTDREARKLKKELVESGKISPGPEFYRRIFNMKWGFSERMKFDLLVSKIGDLAREKTIDIIPVIVPPLLEEPFAHMVFLAENEIEDLLFSNGLIAMRLSGAFWGNPELKYNSLPFLGVKGHFQLGHYLKSFIYSRGLRRLSRK